MKKLMVYLNFVVTTKGEALDLMVSRIGLIICLAVLSLIGGLIMACGGGEGTAVNVSLKEYSITLSANQVKAGRVEFVTRNEGTEAHELVVIRSDLPPDALPVKEGKVDEAQVDTIGEIEEFPPNRTQGKAFDLRAGKYILICNITEPKNGGIESHYQEGMRTALTVVP